MPVFGPVHRTNMSCPKGDAATDVTLVAAGGANASAVPPGNPTATTTATTRPNRTRRPTTLPAIRRPFITSGSPRSTADEHRDSVRQGVKDEATEPTGERCGALGPLRGARTAWRRRASPERPSSCGPQYVARGDRIT